jgi:CDP-glycerol glycerophosphotransferase (TagB/SpsB family)
LGYPRISKHSTSRNEAEGIIELQAKRRLNHGKKNILWLPSHTKTTSLYTFAPVLAKIQTDYNIIVKPHPLLLNIEKFITSIIPEVTIINQVSNDKLLPAADFSICDYGGSVFLSIMADKNTLLFNADKPEFPPELSIQDIPELAIRDRIINFYTDEEEKFFTALKDDSVWEKQKEIRAQIRAEFFTDNPDPARDIAELCRRIVKGEL